MKRKTKEKTKEWILGIVVVVITVATIIVLFGKDGVAENQPLLVGEKTAENAAEPTGEELTFPIIELTCIGDSHVNNTVAIAENSGVVKSYVVEGATIERGLTAKDISEGQAILVVQKTQSGYYKAVRIERKQ